MKYITFILFGLFLSSCCVCEDDYMLRCEGLSESIEYNPETINRKVLVIGIDGIRSDAMQDSISPFLFDLSLQEDTYFTDSHMTERITYSGPNWSSLLTGVHMSKHNVLENEFLNPNFYQYPSFFYYLENIEEPINTVSIVNWLPIHTHILSDVVDYAPTESISDLEVFNSCKEILLNNNPVEGDVIFLHFDELDGAGHSYGFSADVEEYRTTLTTIDGYTEELFNIIESKRDNGEDWIVFIVSDHGGAGTGHGDAENPHINQTVFYTQHPNLNFTHYHTTSMADLAPTILDFMGVGSDKYHCIKDGVSIIE